ncbi:NTTRR-F1 domain [Priestia megaterium]
MSIQNLIINGSFETGTLTPWTSANTTVTNQFSHSGSFSARFQSSPFTSYIGQFVPLNPGESMEVLASFAKVGTAPSTPVFIQVTFYDSLSNFLGAGLGTTIPVDHIPTADNDTWLEIYQTTTPAPPNTAQAFILIYTSPQAGTANVLVDDVALLLSVSTNGLNEFRVGTNASPLPILTNLTFLPLSTVTITTDNPGDTVKLTASIHSATSSSTVTSNPLQGNTVSYRIRRISPNQTIRTVQDTDFDELTTDFTALDNPGVGTFTYVLEGNLERSTAPVQTEPIQSVVFTAEEIGPNTP